MEACESAGGEGTNQVEAKMSVRIHTSQGDSLERWTYNKIPRGRDGDRLGCHGNLVMPVVEGGYKGQVEEQEERGRRKSERCQSLKS